MRTVADYENQAFAEVPSNFSLVPTLHMPLVPPVTSFTSFAVRYEDVTVAGLGRSAE